MRAKHLPEIDLLRGVGAVMMIANHFGYGLLSRERLSEPVGSFWVTFGSFAPVLFFLTTGIGVGLQRGRPAPFGRVAIKVVILFAADAIMMLSLTGKLGFDFLAFIGLSTLICSLVARSKHALILSGVGLLTALALRFGAGVVMRHHLSHEELSPLSFFLGTETVQGISYPLAPWLCFPFLGFFLSPFLDRPGQGVRWWGISLALLITGLAILISSWIAVSRGAIFFRYSTVSAAFFAAAIGVALVATGLCRMMANAANPAIISLSHFIETRGVACLAIVPIHYLLLELLRTIGLSDLSQSKFVIVLAAAIAVCLMLGRELEAVGKKINAVYSAPTILGVAAIIVISAIVAACESSSTLTRMLALFFGQATLCVLLMCVDGWLTGSDTRELTTNAKEADKE